MSNNAVKRNQVPAEYKWDLSKIFKDYDTWKKAFLNVTSEISEIKQAISRMDKNIDSFVYALEIVSSTKRNFDDIKWYAKLKFQEDMSISIHQNMNDQVSNLEIKLDSVASTLQTKLLSMDKTIIDKYILKEKRLESFKIFINNILRKKPHTLTDKEEEILSGTKTLAIMPEKIFDIVTNMQMKFPSIKDNDGNYIQINNIAYQTLMFNNNREVRKTAYESLYNTYAEQKQIFGTTLFSSMQATSAIAKARNYNSALEASLFEENISINTYNSLINAVKGRINIFHKYLSLRKKCLGYDKLYMYDIQVPFVKQNNINIKYKDLKELALTVLKPLGEEYVKDLKNSYEKGWIDALKNDGKCFYPYSTATYNSQPYVSVNYDETVLSASTWIHEMGHAMHYYYSFKNQPYANSMFSIFTAEVVAILNEQLYAMYLINNSRTKAEKLQYINHFLEQFRIAVFRQTMSAEFEKLCYEKIEKGKIVTADDYSKIYSELNKFYYGKDVVTDEYISLDWSRIPHMYTSFYLYKYAVGFSAAAALSKKLINKNDCAQEKYIELLKSGGNDFPINQLKKVGVDMDTTKPIEQALDIFENLIDEFEKLLDIT